MNRKIKSFNFVDNPDKIYTVVSQNKDELIVDTKRLKSRIIANCEFIYFASLGMLNITYA
jgi:hypothetical protein